MKTYFKFFFRQIFKRRLFFLINLFGLTIAFIVCIYSYLYLNYEKNFDKYPDTEKIYRLTNTTEAKFAPVMMKYIQSNVAGINKVCRVLQTNGIIGDSRNIINEDKIVFTDSTFYSFFPSKVIYGNENQFLRTPNSAIITKSEAEKLFGNTNVIGKTLSYNQEKDFIIDGVIEDYSEQSSLQPNIIISIGLLKKDSFNMSSPFSKSAHFYFKVKENTNIQDLEFQINATLLSKKELKLEDRTRLQSLADIHLHSNNIEFDFINTGNYKNIQNFLIIALLILIVAIFNYINLSTANNSLRNKEIGIKKIMGVNRFSLIMTIIFESIFISTIAMLIALFIVDFTQNYTQSIFGFYLKLSQSNITSLLSLGIGIIIVTGILSGIYPAVITSNKDISSILKGGFTSKNKKSTLRLRQLIVGLQFLISIGLLSITILIFNQMQYIKNHNLGIDTDHIIALRNPWKEKYSGVHQLTKNTLIQNPNIKFITGSNQLPSKDLWFQHIIQGNWNGQRTNISVNVINVEGDFLEKMDSKVVAGSLFNSTTEKANANHCVINESLYKKLGDDCIGKELSCFFDGKKRKIIGAIGDIHYSSLHHTVPPSVYYSGIDNLPYTTFSYIKFNSGRIDKNINILKEHWNSNVKGWPIEYIILDQELKQLYNNDIRNMRLISILAVIAIIISMSGLLGLIIFTITTKTKELGIRIVHGASLGKLILTLSKGFITLICIAWILSLPLTILYFDKWSSHFSYITEISYYSLIVSGVIISGITFIIMFIQTRAAIRNNPIESLKSE
ncbi:MAG: ABC transporter permease [Hyphomicrobiales bacterium]